jgi:Mor family transcriptional regulator
VSRNTVRRKVRVEELTDELAVGAAMRLRCESDDIHAIVQAVVSYLMDEYPAQELYIPAHVAYPIEQLRAEIQQGKSVRSICKKHRIDRRTLYRVIGEG